RRAGWPGAIAAWLGFTLPSAVLLVLFARGLAWAGEGNEWLASLVQSLKIVAVAVVAQAVWMMSRTLCPDAARRAIALLTALGVLLASGVAVQVVALAVCAAIGARLFAEVPTMATVATVATAAHDTGVGARTGWAALVLFVALLLGLPLIVAAVDVEWLAV